MRVLLPLLSAMSFGRYSLNKSSIMIAKTLANRLLEGEGIGVLLSLASGTEVSNRLEIDRVKCPVHIKGTSPNVNSPRLGAGLEGVHSIPVPPFHFLGLLVGVLKEVIYTHVSSFAGEEGLGVGAVLDSGIVLRGDIS